MYPLFLLLAAAVLFRGAPHEYRPLAVLPLFVEPRFLLYAFGGVSDIVWAALLLLVVTSWEHRVGRGLWYGLACAFKQQPWFLAPFFLVRIWHESRGSGRRPWREMAVFAMWSAVPFLALNLPFLVADPGAWLGGVSSPFFNRMIVFGQGLSALAVTGHVI